MSIEIIKEVCDELNIKYTDLSKNWITKLEKDNKVRYICGNKFDINGVIVNHIMDDKYALFCVLKNLGIPVCEHTIFYNQNNQNSFASNCHTINDLIECFNKYNHDVVIKPNIGFQGKGVYHVTNKDELLEKTNLLLKNKYSISICPFYHIINEYRVILLDNNIKLLFKKINPVVIGDGVSTLKELLIKFNPYYFNNADIPDLILDSNQEYVYDFRFNLSKGSIASIDIENSLKEKISKLAIDVTKKIGIRFASIDIIETTSHELLIMEANSGVTINKVINFIPNGYEIAKVIYKEAILKMFSD